MKMYIHANLHCFCSSKKNMVEKALPVDCVDSEIKSFVLAQKLIISLRSDLIKFCMWKMRAGFKI